MNVTCVVEDAVQRNSRFWGEHGLAFLIEAGGRRVLFDTGQSGTVLLHNLGLLEVDPSTVDAVGVSHAHHDHTGGLDVLMGRLRPGVPLYANPDLFRERFSRRGGELRNVGLPLTRDELAVRFTLELSPEPREVVPGVWTTGEITERPEPEGGSDRHLARVDDDLVADTYGDDVALVLEVDDGLVPLCGCCHAGLLNTLAHVERGFEGSIVIVVGGLHLTSAAGDELRHVGEVLGDMAALRRVYPNHCTGEAAFVALTRVLGSSVVRPCPAGTELDLEVRA